MDGLRMTMLIDLVLSGLVLVLGWVVLVPAAGWWRWRRRPGPRRIVYLGTGQIAQVFPRNGVNLFLERECSDFGGYFEQMWNVHFPAGARGGLSLTPRHHLIDVDFVISPRLAGRLRLTPMVWREVRFLFWLLPFLVHSRASIVTATNPYLQGLNAALAAQLLGLPYAVIITRDYDWDWAVLRKQAFRSVYPTRWFERTVGRWVLRHANLVLADRQYYRQFAIRNGAAPARAIATRVLADGAFSAAPASASNVRERYGLGYGPLLSYVGRLDADKFPLDLVECLSRIHAQVPDVVLACAGTGALAEQMRTRAAELGVEAHLKFLGALDLADLPALLAASDVFVAPHTGYTLIEAGLTGVPIVTYDYDFHAEIVEDGKTGYLAPLRDVATLADRVCRLLADPAAARAMGARLRSQLLREHSLEAVVPLYRQAYDQVLGNSGRLRLRTVYALALGVWLVTRWLVLVHMGAWPWMNAFVVAAARGIVVGDWNEAVRPQLPAVLGVPLVLAGASEQQAVAALYVLASLVQFGAFVFLVRALFPGRLAEQSLALLVFLLVPYNHSIHHYRDVPVVLASSAVFLLSATWLTWWTGDRGPRTWVTIFGAMLLGVWSRAEVLTFVGGLVVLGLVVWRRRALPLVATYAVAAGMVAGSLLLVYRLEGVDLSQASRYQWHTFLDSTPESWLTPACRSEPTENCRESDGLTYFGPADPEAGVVPMVLNHPLATVAKTVRSAADNLWDLLGPNLSTFPGIVPFELVALACVRPARDALWRVPAAVWMVVLAVVGESVLPPLSWAPPHPQYHLQMVLPIAVLVVPILMALARMPRGRLVALAFLIGNAGLSAFRYTRYPGY